MFSPTRETLTWLSRSERLGSELTCEEKVQTRKSVWDRKWMSRMTPRSEFSV